MRWGVVVAAGGHADPELASAIGTSRKALASFSGRTSLEFTLSAVSEAGFAECVTVGGEEILPHVSHGDFALESETAVDNVLIGMERLRGVDAVLLLPSDSPLITSQMLAHFVEGVSLRKNVEAQPNYFGNRWFSAGLARAADFASTYQGIEMRPIKLKGCKFVSGALYATTSEGIQAAVEIFRQARRGRKSQFKLVSQFGFGNVIRYFLGSVSLPAAERILTKGLGGATALITDCHPATCLDFDTAEEFAYIKRLMENPGA